MDFGSSSKEGFSEEEEQMGKLGKFPFPYSSSSSSQQKTQLPRHQIYHQLSCPNRWLGNRYEPEEEEEDNEAITVTETADECSKHVEKEHMFDKVVTPSDVGKLNRLVIPKQHAEKYFPLDSSTDVKGLLLNFEDRNGKPWRFRYSYWNSSQSYVMTKGWSRFVKDKKLDAGDVVSFQRVVGEVGKDRRLFIDWKRRPNASTAVDPVFFHPQLYHHQQQQQQYLSNLHRSAVPWSPLLMPPPPAQSTGSGTMVYPRGTMGSVFYLTATETAIDPPIVFDSVPVVQGKAAAKRLRLFGVNMELCPPPISSSSSSSPSPSPSSHCDDQIEMLSPTTKASSHSQLAPQLISSSSSKQYPLQLRLYNGTPMDFLNNGNKGKGNSMSSFDLDM